MATLDQSFETNDSSLSLHIDYPHFAQSLTVGLSGEIDSVDLLISKNAGATGTVSVYIFSDSGSDTPSVALSDGSTLDISTLTTSLAWTNFIFASKATVTAGQKVWIYVYFVGDASHWLNVGLNSTGGYSGNSKYSATTPISWVSNAPNDMDFREYVNVTANSVASLLFNFV